MTSKPKPAVRRRLRQRERHARRATGPVTVHPERLAPDGSYSTPDFLRRGTYVDLPFTCIDCGVDEIWRATQQQWWYEIAKGGIWTTATRCRSCRANERRRRDAARATHLAGVTKDP
nr:zinc-ribbon domain containing protein [Panacagrimonas sp.]